LKPKSVRSLIVTLLLLSALTITLANYATPPLPPQLLPAQLPKVNAAVLTITLSATSGVAGDVITVLTSATTAPAGTVCSVAGNGPGGMPVSNPIVEVFNDPPLTGHGIFTVGSGPGAPASGTYTITVTCGPDSGSTTFTVNPLVTPSPLIGTAGELISFTGVGFASDASGACTVGGSVVVTTPKTCTITAGTGVASGSFTVAAVADSSYTITITPNSGATASPSFTKVSSPTIALVNGAEFDVPPGYGTAGSSFQVKVTGGGFAPNPTRPCTLSASGGPGSLIALTPAPSCSIDSAGTVTASYSVAPTALPGSTFALIVTDSNPPGVTASTGPASIVVGAVPSLTLSGASGAAGTLVTITSGSSWGALDAGVCTISSVPTGLISSSFCVITSGGTLLVTPPGGKFTVSPTAPGQTYNLIVTGSHGDPSASPGPSFTVTPSITGPGTSINPGSGSPPLGALSGTTVTITGTGFKPTDTGCTVVPSPLDGTHPNIVSSLLCSVNPSTGILTATFVVAAGAVWNGGGYGLAVTGTPGDAAPTPVGFNIVPRIQLNPTSGLSGSTIAVSGDGFAPGPAAACNSFTATPSSLFAAVPAASCHLATDGTVSATFTVDAAALNGPYAVAVQGTAGGDAAAPVTFTKGAAPVFTPSIILSPNSGPVGTGVTITGSGFNPADAGSCLPVTSIPLPDIVTLPSCSISASGQLSASFTVSNTAAPGAHTIKVAGSTGDLALATFTVTTVTPRITITPAAGPSGITVGVTASGFSSSDTSLTFLVSPTTLTMSTTTCVISPVGSGGCTFTATMTSSVPQGYTISAIGNIAGDTAPATFILSSTPSSISVSPTSGPSGTLISVSGTIPVAAHGSPPTGYTSCTIGGGSGSGISISTSSCQIISFTPAASGLPAYSTFAGSFIVGNQAPGTYTVRVTGSGASAPSGYANYVEATFILTGPKIILNPSSGGRGLSVAVTGSGFSFADNTCSVSSSNGNLIQNNACTINGGTGAASGGFIVGSLNPGTYSVRLTGNTGDFAETTFTVVAGPSIKLTPSSGAVGTTVSVTGSGFFLTDSSCSISGTGVSAQACSVNLSSGAPSGSFLVGNVVAGSYTITLSANGGDFAQAVFVVTSVTAGLTLYPSGPVTPGTTVTFTATGLLTPDTGCSLQATPSTIILSSPTCRISSAGVATGSFVVSYLATADRNPWTIQVVGSPGGDVVSGSLSIIPVIGVTPSSGTSGTQFAFTGYGFSLTATTCTVLPSPGTWSALNCGVTSNGQVSGSFVSGSNPAGVYAVTVKDSSGLTAIGFATIGSPTASISVTPNAVPPGQAGVAVVGSGFNPSDTACTITSGAGLFSGTPSCSVSGGFVAGSFNVLSSAPAGYYVITATGTTNGDFALNILYVTPSGATTTTTISSSTSIISTGYTTVTSTTPVTLTTTTFTWTGVSTETDYTLTTTTFTGLSTSSQVTTTITTSIESSVSTMITTTTTTYIATVGAIVAPAFSSGSSRAVDGAALGLLSVITLLGWVLFRRLAF
jgi:hypothetical protein